MTQPRVMGNTLVKRHFMPPTVSDKVHVQIHFGIANKLIKTVETEGSVYGTPISMWNDTLVGRIERDRSFSLTIYKEESQRYLVDMCQRLSNKTFAEQGTLKCWPLDFKNWLEAQPGGTWPVSSEAVFYE